ncbi:hypothetical protein N7492_010193 [Penicillium capsulatum]|uniref:PLC-like phosphodiesterase n=1 Tax=Penicillium capsulatum TaxID=69766 RepID=A0A9W9LEW9_9EURO|nr:hypothetical protein N7492_010193 [Penicillium capsulatum]
MRWPSLVLALLAGVARAADETTTTTTDASSSSSLALSNAVTVTNPSDAAMPSGTYQEVSTTLTLDDGRSSVSVSSSMLGNSSAHGNQTTFTSTSESVTVLVGAAGPTTLGNSTMANGTATIATSLPSATNSQPCNNYAEFCPRKYSNITMVAAHNSPFVRKGNAAANQAYKVTAQLNDVQFQTHNQNGTLRLCHTSCDIIDVGTLEDYLREVNTWMRQNPYEVVTILMGNSDQVDPQLFVDPIKKSGLETLAYKPPKAPMGLHDWPTLSDMILHQKRVVFFLDYKADQSKISWLMDEFSQLWETPFSPTNPKFPCTQQRPPGLSKKDAGNRMYMANHNLNLQLTLGPIDLLIPNYHDLSSTNAVNGEGSLGLMANNCISDWGRAPNFLLVDFYNFGEWNGSTYNGSVFQVAAQLNNVSYNRDCCGTSSAAMHATTVASVSSVLLLVAGVQFFLSVF